MGNIPRMAVTAKRIIDQWKANQRRASRANRRREWLNNTALDLQHEAISLLKEVTELTEQHCNLKKKWAHHYGMFHFHLTRLHASVNECLCDDSSLTSADNYVFFAIEQLQNMKTQVHSVKHLISFEDEVEKAMRCPTQVTEITEAQSEALSRKLEDSDVQQRAIQTLRNAGMARKKWAPEVSPCRVLEFINGN